MYLYWTKSLPLYYIYIYKKKFIEAVKMQNFVILLGLSVGAPELQFEGLILQPVSLGVLLFVVEVEGR